jgi:iron complex transport system substrate-binding protein
VLNYVYPVIGLAILTLLAVSSFEPVTIQNFHYDLSENVEVFDKIPNRVITTNGAATEIMLGLGLEKRMVGTCYLDNPPLPEHQAAYDSIPVISRRYPTKEQVLALDPDFILGWQSVFAPQTIGDPSYWNKLGVGTFILRDSWDYPKTIPNIYEDIKDLGRIFHVEERATAIIEEMQREIKAAAELGAKREKKLRVALLHYQLPAGIRCRGDDTIAGQMLKVIGVENVFPMSGDQNKERIAAANPDAVILVYMDATLEQNRKIMEEFYNDPILRYTNASKNRHIGFMPLTEAYCPGVRLAQGIRHMSEILFPPQEQ